jgi:plasmid maintenance system antidote protein VapI
MRKRQRQHKTDLETGSLGEEEKVRCKPRRKPVFALTPEQVIERCRKRKHCLWVAGQVLALMALMNHCQWTIKELSEHSGVSRSHLSEILVLEATASTQIQNTLAETFGFQIFEFHLLTAFSLRSEVSG